MPPSKSERLKYYTNLSTGNIQKMHEIRKAFCELSKQVEELGNPKELSAVILKSYLQRLHISSDG